MSGTVSRWMWTYVIVSYDLNLYYYSTWDGTDNSVRSGSITGSKMLDINENGTLSWGQGISNGESWRVILF